MRLPAFVRYWLPPLLYGGVIFTLATIPGDTGLLPTWPYLDKLLHAVEYLPMGWLLARALTVTEPDIPRGFVWWWVLCVSVGFGSLCELYQIQIPTRSAEVADVVADGIGAWLGAWALGRRSVVRPS